MASAARAIGHLEKEDDCRTSDSVGLYWTTVVPSSSEQVLQTSSESVLGESQMLQSGGESGGPGGTGGNGAEAGVVAGGGGSGRVYTAVETAVVRADCAGAQHCRSRCQHSGEPAISLTRRERQHTAPRGVTMVALAASLAAAVGALATETTAAMPREVPAAYGCP